MHWAFDPFTAISAMYWEVLQGVFALLYEMALFSLLFVFPILYFTFSRLFKLRTLLLFIPFALNYELAAREEFCRRARSRLVVAALEAEGRVYRGAVTACDGDVVVIDGGEGEYVVPWARWTTCWRPGRWRTSGGARPRTC